MHIKNILKIVPYSFALNSIFSIYRSSAGSGKTRTLAKEYLKLALQQKAEYFKYILAVTFTNKASQEMKDRILFYLDEFAGGRKNDLAEELQAELKLDPFTFQERAQAAQAAVLHQYAQFSISTIDAFFQKVIRSFTRETGLVGDYRLEVEQDAVLEQVIDNLIDELGTNEELTNWVVDFAKENLENERAWDVRYSLIDFAREIFREEFKAIEDEVTRITSQPGYFKSLQSTLADTRKSFLSKVSKPAQQALKVIQANGWTPEDFSYGKNSGLITFFRMFAYEKNIGRIKAPGDRIRNHFCYPEKWPGKNTPHAKTIVQVAGQELVPALTEILEIFDEEFTTALTAETAVKNLYVFGLIADIARKLKEYKDENSLMLLADAPKFLNGVIQDSDTPFIYEKVGSFYKHYLIDEFQDTSGMQWKNFQPLITNSLDQGQSCLVVGDVKQAIYRWRGGDLNLLQKQIVSQIGNGRVDIKELDRNFRSAPTIVNFNNEFFRAAAKFISAYTNDATPAAAYETVVQTPFRQEEGYVRIQLIDEAPDEENLFSGGDDESQTARWKEQSLDLMTRQLEELQASGVQLKDIAILVRKNDEGQRVAAHLLQYKNSDAAKPGFRYDVVSNESLRIDGAASVNLLLGAMYYLLNPENAIARAQLGYEYAKIHEPARPLSEVFAVSSQVFFENNLPPAFTKEKASLKKLGLIELTETLVEIFHLGNIKGELVYLTAFQDLVLEFYSRERNDLGAFLEWWEENKHKKSIQLSGDINAAQIITIHKSKGLQFPFVLIPFCSWAMDHDNWQAPNLWVKTEKDPFADAGFLPVKYGASLAETYFADAYRDEHTRIYLDNLNLLYVAFTRAEKGLLITAPAPTVKGSKDSVAGILYQTITSSESLKTNYNDGALTWSAGNINPNGKTSRPLQNTVTLEKYASNRWQKKIVIKRSADGVFDDTSEHQLKINYGVLVHRVLSRIKTYDQIDDTLQVLQHEGLIGDSDLETITASVKSLFSMAQVLDWFSDKWTIKTETPIILPDGKEARIDRLLLADRKAIVIDFKTGSPNKKDEQQVKEYMEIMREMNFTEVEGYLLYLRDNVITEIKAEGRQKVVKKAPPKDQLSLGF